MKIKLFILSVILMLFATGNGPASCDSSISGTVKDGSGEGMEGVEVMVTCTDEGTTMEPVDTKTNSDGVYSFNDLPPGNYSITASSGSYSKTRAVVIEDYSGESAACSGVTQDFILSSLGNDESRFSLWRLEESSGTITDTEGANDGTFGQGSAAPETAAAAITNSNCLYFDGNDYIDLGTLSVVSGDIDLSVAMFVKFSSTDITSTAQLIDCNYATSDTYRGFQMYVNYASGIRRVRFGCHQDDVFGYVSAGIDIGDNRWYFVVGVRDHSGSGKFKMYIVDDTEALTSYEGNDTTAGAIVDAGGNAHYSMGSHYLKTQGFYKGYIDSVLVYKKALTQYDVELIYGVLTE